MQVASAPGEIQDRVGYQLARPVVGDVAPPVDPQRLDGRVEQVRRVPGCADGVDRHVFQQQKRFLRAFPHLTDQPFLYVQGLGITDYPKIAANHGRPRSHRLQP